MNGLQLKDVDEFEISNKFGKIYFFGKTDLRGVDLGKEVSIE